MFKGHKTPPFSHNSLPFEQKSTPFEHICIYKNPPRGFFREGSCAPGRVIDEEFANILLRNPELTLYQVMLLDKVQKKKSLTDSEIALLKKLKFIEGRKPNFFLSDIVVKLTEDEKLKADYIKNKSFGDDYYRDLILKYIRKYHRATKDDISALVLNLLSPILSSKQKASKVTNLLSSLRIRGLIEYKGGFWVLKN